MTDTGDFLRYLMGKLIGFFFNDFKIIHTVGGVYIPVGYILLAIGIWIAAVSVFFKWRKYDNMARQDYNNKVRDNWDKWFGSGHTYKG